ncbi:hypothetical protein [Tsuneonella suprasediminis]|uniref:hypothetical protein n=1 Tax=Tsuneonella suprasediminis TaxID=2306996 RepID=UPI002F95FCC7
MKLVRNVMLSLALSSLVAAPVAAQARAKQSTAVQEKGVNKRDRLLILVGFIAAAVGIVLLADKSDDSPVSP